MMSVPNIVNYNVSNPKCNVDPSKVMLLNVRRSFWGNYSCQAQNRAGWGSISEAKEMKVLYPPEGATIKSSPVTIIKGKPLEVSLSYMISWEEGYVCKLMA